MSDILVMSNLLLKKLQRNRGVPTSKGHALCVLFLLSLPLAAQSLSLTCPPPTSFNQSAVCQVVLSTPATTPVSGAQWALTTNPKTTLTVASLIPSKSVGAGPTGIYLLSGANQTPISGAIASVTIPPHSGAVTIMLSQPLGTSPAGHAIPLSPGASATVQ